MMRENFFLQGIIITVLALRAVIKRLFATGRLTVNI
jgi:hypothetical protein